MKRGTSSKSAFVDFSLLYEDVKCFQSLNQELTIEARLVTNLSRRGKLLAITGHVFAMTRVSRIAENGGRLIYRNIRTHTTWKSSSGFLVKKEPIITSSRVLLCSIHGCYIVPYTSIVRTVVCVKRPLFVVSCGFV